LIQEMKTLFPSVIINQRLSYGIKGDKVLDRMRLLSIEIKVHPDYESLQCPSFSFSFLSFGLKEVRFFLLLIWDVDETRFPIRFFPYS
jgi:hypothetical protein